MVYGIFENKFLCPGNVNADPQLIYVKNTSTYQVQFFHRRIKDL